jgi:Phenazine biosynthesis-like protein
MPVLQYVHLDVFTNQPFTGIQLAVFLDAAGIDERRMQRIANEMAFPETTFVFPPEVSGTDARVRIFTPSAEDTVHSPNWPRWADRFFARRSTCARDVSPDAAKRHFPPSPRPPLQPAYQNPRRSAQARDTLKMGRDWPLMPSSRHNGAKTLTNTLRL